MFKKVITVVLSLCLISGISVMAENAVNNIPENGAAEQVQDMNPAPPQSENNAKIPDDGEMQNPDFPPDMQNGEMPFGDMEGFPGDMPDFGGWTTQEEQPMSFMSFLKTYSTPVTSIILLIFAFIFVIFYKRKNY